MARGKAADPNALLRFLATGGPLGYAPIAPGTVGSAAWAVLLFLLLPEVTLSSGRAAIATLLVSVAAFTVLAVRASTVAEAAYGKDASRIVIDEFAGFLLAVLFLPKSLLLYGVAFVLFRALDIVKPFPAGRAESLPGGLGVVVDDLVAGVYANVLLRLMLLARGW
jgi:phosphatidylglycerophosphatase A